MIKEQHTLIPEKMQFLQDLSEFKATISTYLEHFARYGYDAALQMAYRNSNWNTSFLDQEYEQGDLTMQAVERFLQQKTIAWLRAYGVVTEKFQEIDDPMQVLEVVEQVTAGRNYVQIFIKRDGLQLPLSESDRAVEQEILQLSEAVRRYGMRAQGNGLYSDLCISVAADERAIKSAYRNLCQTFHPDKLFALQKKLAKVEDQTVYKRGQELISLMTQIMAKVNLAYEVLGDTEKRTQYVV